MLSDDEVYKRVRDEILPLAKELNEKVFDLYLCSVGLIGPQGYSGPINDVSIAYQLIDGSKNMLKQIASRENSLSIPDRG